MNKNINDVSQIMLKSIEISLWIKLHSVYFLQNGRHRTRHITSRKNRVAIILYNKPRKVLVFVKQFRPAVYISSIPGNYLQN